jgi:CRISPR-associated endonuclease Csy4
MTHYVDIKLKPTDTMKANVILNSIYAELHKALHSMGSDSIGVSFPEHSLILGKTIRLHGTEENLKELMDSNWIEDRASLCFVSSINKIPENCQSFVKTSSIQPRMSQSKFRRLVKRGSISKEEEKKYKIKMLQSSIDKPFMVLKSASNNNTYKRFFVISKTESLIEGSFDSFGTSKIASVPSF